MQAVLRSLSAFWFLSTYYESYYEKRDDLKCHGLVSVLQSLPSGHGPSAPPLGLCIMQCIVKNISACFVCM